MTSFSYHGQPDTRPIDAVRLLIGDTEQCAPILMDGEITYALNIYNNAPMNAAIRCCEFAIAKYSRLVDETVGQVKMTYSQRMKGFLALQTTLRNRLATEDATPYAGGISRSDVQTVKLNPNRVPPFFTRRMMEDWQLSPWIMGQPGTFFIEDFGE